MNTFGKIIKDAFLFIELTNKGNKGGCIDEG